MSNELQILTGTKTVAAAATPERLSATDKLVSSVVIQAIEDNTGSVYADQETSPVSLVPISYKIHQSHQRINLRNIWVRVGVDGEGVVWTATV